LPTSVPPEYEKAVEAKQVAPAAVETQRQVLSEGDRGQQKVATGEGEAEFDPGGTQGQAKAE